MGPTSPYPKFGCDTTWPYSRYYLQGARDKGRKEISSALFNSNFSTSFREASPGASQDDHTRARACMFNVPQILRGKSPAARRPGVQCVPLSWSSVIWSFRVHGQFLPGPERNGISYNKISRIYGLDPGYMVNFRGHWGRFSRPLRSVYKAAEDSVKAVDAVDVVCAATSS